MTIKKDNTEETRVDQKRRGQHKQRSRRRKGGKKRREQITTISKIPRY
jgi:hypothetical protein